MMIQINTGLLVQAYAIKVQIEVQSFANSWKPSCSDPISANNKDFSIISFGTHLFLYFSKDEISFS